MDELAPGPWHWTAPHPGWEPGEPWDRNVSSYAIDSGDRLLLFDPLGVPDEIEARAPDRETAIVLTAPWHERDARSLVERLDVPVYTPRPDAAEYLVQTYGITAEQAGDGSPDVVWLLKGGIGEAHLYAAGDLLDVGVLAFPGQKPNDMVLWIESHRATGQAPVYRYLFSRRIPVAPGQVQNGRPVTAEDIGARHAGEIEYVFGTLDSIKGVTWTPEDRALSDAIGRYWTNFAKTGDPNGEGLQTWPRLGPGPAGPIQDMGPRIIDLDTTIRALPEPNRARYEVLDALLGAAPRP